MRHTAHTDVDAPENRTANKAIFRKCQVLHEYETAPENMVDKLIEKLLLCSAGGLMLANIFLGDAVSVKLVTMLIDPYTFVAVIVILYDSVCGHVPPR